MMQQPTEWMARNIAHAIVTRLISRDHRIQMFSIDRYNYVGEICPSMRSRLMEDNNTYLFIEL